MRRSKLSCTGMYTLNIFSLSCTLIFKCKIVFKNDFSWFTMWAFSSVKSLSNPNSLPKYLKEDPQLCWDFFIIDRKVRAVLLVTAFFLSHTKRNAFIDP